MNKETFILQIVEKTQPVRPFSQRGSWVRLWFIISLFIVGLGAGVLGLRPDLISQFHSFDFVFESIVLLFLSITTVYTAFRICIPGKRQRQFYIFILLLALWSFSLFVKLFIEFNQRGMMALQTDTGWSCIWVMLGLSIIPSVMIYFLIRTGTTVYPLLTGILVALAGASLGSLGVQFTCSASAPMHLILWHFLPLLGVGITMGILGYRLFRW